MEKLKFIFESSTSRLGVERRDVAFNGKHLVAVNGVPVPVRSTETRVNPSRLLQLESCVFLEPE